MLVAGNDRIQAIITQMEEICKTIEVSRVRLETICPHLALIFQLHLCWSRGSPSLSGKEQVEELPESLLNQLHVARKSVSAGTRLAPLTHEALLMPLLPLQDNGRRQKQHLCLRFDSLYSTLEERKKELLQEIGREQEEKVQRVRGLIRQYGDHLEVSSKLVESAIQSMEEPQMAVYLQVWWNPGPHRAGLCMWEGEWTCTKSWGRAAEGNWVLQRDRGASADAKTETTLLFSHSNQRS